MIKQIPYKYHGIIYELSTISWIDQRFKWHEKTSRSRVDMYYIFIFTHLPSHWTLHGLSSGWHLWMFAWPSWFSAWVVFLPIVSPESSWVQSPPGENFFFSSFFLNQKVYLIVVSYQKILLKHYPDVIKLYIVIQIKNINIKNIKKILQEYYQNTVWMYEYC